MSTKIVKVTRAQRLAAQVLVEIAAKKGEAVSPAIAIIANAKRLPAAS